MKTNQNIGDSYFNVFKGLNIQGEANNNKETNSSLYCNEKLLSITEQNADAFSKKQNEITEFDPSINKRKRGNREEAFPTFMPTRRRVSYEANLNCLFAREENNDSREEPDTLGYDYSSSLRPGEF